MLLSTFLSRGARERYYLTKCPLFPTLRTVSRRYYDEHEKLRAHAVAISYGAANSWRRAGPEAAANRTGALERTYLQGFFLLSLMLRDERANFLQSP